MPITQSAKKALRQSLRRRGQNIKRKEAYKLAVKNIRAFASAGKSGEAGALVLALYKALDKAAKTNVIKPNKASRLKSRLTRFLSKAAR